MKQNETYEKPVLISVIMTTSNGFGPVPPVVCSKSDLMMANL
jgi:hypothetical protein